MNQEILCRDVKSKKTLAIKAIKMDYESGGLTTRTTASGT